MCNFSKYIIGQWDFQIQEAFCFFLISASFALNKNFSALSAYFGCVSSWHALLFLSHQNIGTHCWKFHTNSCWISKLNLPKSGALEYYLTDNQSFCCSTVVSGTQSRAGGRCALSFEKRKSRWGWAQHNILSVH